MAAPTSAPPGTWLGLPSPPMVRAFTRGGTCALPAREGGRHGRAPPPDEGRGGGWGPATGTGGAGRGRISGKGSGGVTSSAVAAVLGPEAGEVPEAARGGPQATGAGGSHIVDLVSARSFLPSRREALLAASGCALFLGLPASAEEGEAPGLNGVPEPPLDSVETEASEGGAVGAPAARPPPLFTEFADPNNGFSLLVPASWEQKDKAGATALFEDPERRGVNLGVVVAPVRISTLAEFGTLDFVADRLLAAERKKESTKAVSLVRQARREGTSRPEDVFYEFEYALSSTRGDKRVLSSVAIARKNLFILNISLPESFLEAPLESNSQSPQLLDALETVLESFDVSLLAL